MSDRTHEVDDELISGALHSLASGIEQVLGRVSVPEPSALRRLRMQRRKRRTISGSVGALVVVAATLIVSVFVSSTPSTTTRILANQPVLDVAPSINLDIVSAQTQISVNLASGSVETSPAFAQQASPGAGGAVAFPRQGYVLVLSPEGYTSVSNDLQHVLHTWSLARGMYPAPASNPADIWLSQPYETPAQAQEFNFEQKPVGAPVPLPSGAIVLGELGQDLILQSAQPSALLELWDPSTQTVVESLGHYDQLARSSTSVAWTSGSVLNIAKADGGIVHEPSGPVGDWSTALAFSPDGSTLAIAWSPSPGSQQSVSRKPIDELRSLSLLNTSSGQTSTVPDSQGTVGPISWTSDGTRTFFAQSSADSASVGISTYRIGDAHSKRLAIPRLALPAYFGPSMGSVFVWDR
jgi:hypothetical protein